MNHSNLRSTIHQLAAEFAAGVLEAIRAASLQEILAETGGRRGLGRAGALAAGLAAGGARFGKGGRLARRSAGDISGMVERIVTLLASKPEGLRAEQIREELGLEAKELPRPIAEALRSRKIGRSGQKRATTYFARGAARTDNTDKAKKAGRASKKRSAAPQKKRGKKRGKARAARAAAHKRTPKRSRKASRSRAGSFAGQASPVNGIAHST